MKLRSLAKIRFARAFYLRILLPLLRWQPLPSTRLGPVKGWHASLRGWLEGDSAANPPGGRPAVLSIAPAQRLMIQPPDIALPDPPANFVRQVHECPAVYVGCLAGARIATPQFEVIGPDDRVFADLFYESIDPPPAQSLRLPRLPSARRLAGSYATVATGRASNYYHWMNDCLTRLWALDQAGLDDYTLIAPDRLAFQRRSLELLGFGSDRSVGFDGGHWLLERLWVPSLTNRPGFSNPAACAWLRQRLLAAVGRRDAPRPQRLFISRAQAGKRRLMNEPEVRALVEQHGFTTLVSEELSLDEQIAHFAAAEAVVAPHGAGLTNALFMPRTATVIELLPSRKVKTCYFSLARALGLRYACVSDQRSALPSSPGWAPDLDFEIPVERLATALQQMGL